LYTWPEVAAVRKTEEQLKKLELSKIRLFPMRGFGRCRASGDTDGLFKKILLPIKTDEVLG